MKLSHCPVRAETSTAPKKFPGSPFLKVGVVLVASLIISCPEPEQKKSEAAKQEQNLTGDYNCGTPRIVGGSASAPAGMPTSLSIYEKNGNLFMTDPLRRMVGLGGIPVTKNDGGFTFEMKRAGVGKARGAGLLSGRGILTYRLTYAMGGSPVTFEWKCKKCSTQKKKETRQKKEDIREMRAVFIRPCEGKLYQHFATKTTKAATAVGGGALGSVAKDLRESGVTDIFLPFKVDDDVNGCGKYGKLLYNSTTYDDRELAAFKTAFSNGFDPIGNLIRTCKNEYEKAGKKVRFHAWFPVFADVYAARIAKQTGYVDKGILGNTWEFVSGLWGGNKPDCVSDTFAEPSNVKVIEYELALLEEITKKYPALCGINLDYIRYSDETECDCAGEADPAKRIKPVTSWVVNAAAIKDFVKKVREKFPDYSLSADVMASSSRRQVVGQDGILSFLDIVIPMMYTPTWVKPSDIGRWVRANPGK